jgi:hypothetical protein
VPVSAENESNGRAEIPADGASVLSNLPRTRPQRSTPRRAAARRAAAGAASKDAVAAKAAKAADAPAATNAPARPTAKRRPQARRPAKPTGSASGRPKRARAQRPRPSTRSRHLNEAVPRQGFESEGDRVSGSVSPPGGTELVASAAEILGEIAKAGLAGGERLLKDALSLLSR